MIRRREGNALGLAKCQGTGTITLALVGNGDRGNGVSGLGLGEFASQELLEDFLRGLSRRHERPSMMPPNEVRKLRRVAERFTNRRLPQKDGAGSVRRVLGGPPRLRRVRPDRVDDNEICVTCRNTVPSTFTDCPMSPR